MPRRIRIAATFALRSRTRLFAQQRRQCGDEIDVDRRPVVLGKQERTLALDQARIEIGLRKGGARDQPGEKFHVVCHTDDAIFGQCL